MVAECQICGGPLGAVLLEINVPDRFERHVGISEEGYSRSWVRCDRCGVAQNQLSSESRAGLASLSSGYYEVDFAGSDIMSKYQKVMGLPACQSDNAGRVKRVLSMLATVRKGVEHFKVVDIGSGTGVFLSKLIEESPFTLDCVAIEPDFDAAKHLVGLNLFEVVNDIFHSELKLREPDLVTLNKVLEHIETPLEFLQSLSASHGQESLIYVEVPDILTIEARPASDNILGPLHWHLYDPKV